MARSAKGINYAKLLALTSWMGGDVERMSPRARRTYFQRRLWLVEAEIQALSDRLDMAASDDWHGWTLAQGPIDSTKWAALVSLDYLIAARESLIAAIQTS